METKKLSYTKHTKEFFYTQKIALLTKAITKQRVIKFTYKQEENYRTIQPHALYIDKLSNTKLDAFQEQGQTDTINKAFKCFKVADMYNLETIESNFTQNNKYNFHSERYNNSICKIGDF